VNFNVTHVVCLMDLLQMDDCASISFAHRFAVIGG